MKAKFLFGLAAAAIAFGISAQELRPGDNAYACLAGGKGYCHVMVLVSGGDNTKVRFTKQCGLFGESPGTEKWINSIAIVADSSECKYRK